MKLFLFLFSLGMTLGGGQALYTFLTNLDPTEIGIEEYLEKGSSKKWLTITGAELDVMDGTYITRIFGTDSLFIPLLVPDTETEEPVKILLHTQDEEALKISKGMMDIDDSDAAAMKYLIEHQEFFLQTRDVTGLVQFGLESDSDDRELLERENDNLADKFVILDEGKKPDGSLSFLLVPGVVLMYLLFFTDKLSGKKEASTPPPPPPPAPPPVPVNN